MVTWSSFGNVVPLSNTRYPYAGDGDFWFTAGSYGSSITFYPGLPQNLTECKEIQLMMRYKQNQGAATKMGVVARSLFWWDGITMSGLQPSYELMPPKPDPGYPIGPPEIDLTPLGESIDGPSINHPGIESYSVVAIDDKVHVHRWSLDSIKITDKKFITDCWGLSLAWAIAENPAGATNDFYFYGLYGCRANSIIF